MQCEKCEKTFEKVDGKNVKKCFECNCDLKYGCINCSKRCNTYNGIYLHNKLKKCAQTPNLNMIEDKNRNGKSNKGKNIRYLLIFLTIYFYRR